jgi:hypothetical protein
MTKVWAVHVYCEATGAMTVYNMDYVREIQMTPTGGTDEDMKYKITFVYRCGGVDVIKNLTRKEAEYKINLLTSGAKRIDLNANETETVFF